MKVRRVIGWLVVVGLVGVGVAKREVLLATYSYVVYFSQADEPVAVWTSGQRAANHPALAGLPVADRLLDHGHWATTEAGAMLRQLRAQFPHERPLLDHYLACWDYWNGRPGEAERVLARAGSSEALVRAAAQAGHWTEVRAQAEDVRNQAGVRYQAWLLLAQHADQAGNGVEAGDCYLRALENYAPESATRLWQVKPWEEVRRRLGREITPARYAASLRVLVGRVNDPQLAEEIMFELGKLQLAVDGAVNQEDQS